MPELPKSEIGMEDIECPWCHADNSEGPAGALDADNGPFDCVRCHKAFEFLLDDDMNMYIQGITTDADAQYLTWKAGYSV